jgi:hypothetical protein
MDDRFLPDFHRAGDLAPRNAADLMPHDPRTAVHAPGEMPTQPMSQTGDDLWERLDARVRARIVERAGRIHTRYAYEPEPGRIAAVVLGDGGLIVAQPITKPSGGPATALTQLRTRPGTARSVQVDADTAAERQAARPTGPVSPPAPASGRSLPADFTGFLGNLPARVQHLMQEPFIGSPAHLQCDHYYFISASSGRGIGARTMHTWCYLTDRREVTFAWGTAFTTGASFAAARWRQTCVRFSVAGRS